MLKHMTGALVGDRNRIVGLLYTKDLILIDPADSIELRTLVGLRGNRCVVYAPVGQHLAQIQPQAQLLTVPCVVDVFGTGA